MTALPYIIAYLFSAVISGLLAARAWRRRQHRIARPFSALMAALAFWCLAHTISVATTNPKIAVAWALIQFGGIVLIGPLWLLFALAYAEKLPRDQRVVWAFLLPTAVFYGLALTNSYHHLWWSSVSAQTTDAFVVLHVTRGPMFWIHALYSYVGVLGGIVVLIRAQANVPTLHRRQARLVLAGALIPMVGNIAHLSSWPFRFVDDPTPLLFVFSGIIFFYASVRYQLLEMAPVVQQQLFESLPDGLVMINPFGTVTEINDNAVQLLAVAAEDYVGTSSAYLLAGSPLRDAITMLIQQPSPGPAHLVSYSRTDGSHSIEVRSRPFITRSGQTAGTLLLLRDVTGRFKMEQALAQRFNETTLLHNLARAASATPGTEDVLRTLSRETQRVLGWDRVTIGLIDQKQLEMQLIVDQSVDPLINMEGHTVTPRRFNALLHLIDKRPLVFQYDDPAPQSEPHRVLADFDLLTGVVVPIHSYDHLLGMLFIGSSNKRDVSTDELHMFETIGKLAAEAVNRAMLYEEAQQASQIKSAFLATVSHELRTPLSSIIGFTDMIASGMFGPMSPMAEESFGYIKHNSKTLLRLINDILDFSKMEAEQFTIDLHPIDVSTVVRTVVGSMQPLVQERGLTLYSEVESNLPLVLGNNQRLEQVLINLVSNGIKFTDRGSILIMARRRENHVQITVHDTGIGIHARDQERIFQVFHQIDNEHTRRTSGTGLGLAISRRLMGLMGGTLIVESTPGQGASFICELPVYTIPAALEQPADVLPVASEQ